MNHDPQGLPRSDLEAAPREDNTLGSSTLHELCAEMIRLREKNDRQHKLFDQTLTQDPRHACRRASTASPPTPSAPISSCARKSRARRNSASAC